MPKTRLMTDMPPRVYDFQIGYQIRKWRTPVFGYDVKATVGAFSDFEGSALYTDREKAALSYAEAVTHSNQQPSATHFERLHAHFHDDAIIELTALIAFQNLSSKFNAALGVEPQGFCSLGPTSSLSIPSRKPTNSSPPHRGK